MYHPLNAKDLLSAPAKQDNLLQVFKTTGIGLWDLTLGDVPMLHFDNCCMTILGLNEANSLSYEAAFNQIHADDRAAVGAAVAKAQAAGSDGKFDVSYRLTGRDKVIRTVRSVGAIRYDKNGVATGASGISMQTDEERMFHEERQKLNTMINNSPDFMGISNNEGVIEYLNKAAFELLGIERTTPVNTLHAKDFYAEPLRTQEIAQLVNREGRWQGEVSLRHFKTGEIIPAYATYEKITDPVTGEQIGRSVTIRDLRGELKAREALRQSELRYKDIVEQAPVGIGVMRGENFVVEAGNDTILELWGKGDSVLGKPIMEAIPELKGQGFEPLLQQVYKTGEPYYGYAVRTTLTYKGELRELYFDFVYTPLRNSESKIDGVMVIASDVTTQVTAQKQVAESEARFRGLIEHAPVATCVFRGRDLVIEVANDPIIKFWGKGPGVLGKPLAEALPELKGQQFLEILDNIFDTGIAYVAQEGRADLEVDGVMGTYYFNFTYQPLFDEEGKVYAIMDMAIDVTEQVLARQQLEKSQQQLLSYFEQSPVAIATIDKEGLVFRMANPFYAELVGRTPEELEGKPLLEALPELEGQGFDELLLQVLATGVAYKAQDVPVNLIRKGVAETIYVNLTYQPQRRANGEISGILVVATDVTPQVSARQALEASEQFTRTVFNDSPVAKIVYVGDDMMIRDANKSMLEMFGRDAADGFIGLPLLEAVPELEGTPLPERYKHVRDTGETFSVSAERIRLIKHGKPYWGYYDYIYKPLRSPDGEIYGVICTAVEVTEQVMARQKLEQTESRLRNAIELAGLATWSYNIKENTFSYSQRFMDWLGFSSETADLDKAYDPLPDEYRTSVPQAIAETISPGSIGLYDNIHPIVNRLTGHTRIIHAQGQVFYDDNGEAETLRGTAQDITMQQELQMALTHDVQERTEELAAAVEELQAANEELASINERLSRSNDELSQYAYVASHDLQEPLRKIRVFSGILSNQASLSDENKPLVEKIDKSADRMSMLIKDLLEFSRLTKGDTLQKQVDLNEVVHTVLTDFELVIAEKKAEISLEPLPVVDAVSLQMNQLFYNLLSNALKFTTPGSAPKILVSAHVLPYDEVAAHIPKPSRYLTYYDIMVSDNGIGFEGRYSEQIFEVFKRLHGRDVYPGSGIGLALCRRIVTNHGGYMYAESAQGIGTTFHIVLPATGSSFTGTL